MKTPTQHTETGFSLVEVALALSVAAFCLLSLLGLIPVGLTANQNAAQQTVAASIATAIAADLRGTPVASGSSSRFQILIPATTTSSTTETLYFSQNGTPAPNSVVNSTHATISGSNPSLYRATIKFNADPNSSKVFAVSILCTWPALADGDPTKLPSGYAGSYETLTALNCH